MIIYLINGLSSIILENRSPLKLLYQRKNNIDHLRVSGGVYFVQKKKFQYYINYKKISGGVYFGF